MDIKFVLQNELAEIINDLFSINMKPEELTVELTRSEFEGDYTLVLFPLVKPLKTKPQDLAEAIGNAILPKLDYIEKYSSVGGFLNLKFKSDFWLDMLDKHLSQKDYGRGQEKDASVMIEYCSPNTNKPLHLGHIRNVLIGWSMYEILTFYGYNVVKTQIINDRGVAICKSMLAWQKYGNNETPASTNQKSDHFVGDYYVTFETKLKEEYKAWQESEGLTIYQSKKKEDESEETFFKRYKNDYFNHISILGAEVREMLINWENGDKETLDLWNKMNGWVYEGFNETYKNIGIDFDKLYYESDTYLLGKKYIEDGLEKGVFYQKEDGSVWVDLTDEGLDEKILLRSDGTSVYITQDIGTALLRDQDFNPSSMIYVVADEQNYHFEVLFKTLKKLGYPNYEKLYHLSYGMVELPSGRMKSREGTVVDADDLMAEVKKIASESAAEKGDLSAFTKEEQEDLFSKVGLAALKYFILKVQPKKKMIFNPEESVDLQGNTGPYIQNAYVRIKSILRKAGETKAFDKSAIQMDELEIDLVKYLYLFESVVEEAATTYDPSAIAGYNYQLAKKLHKYYHDTPILSDANQNTKNFRLFLIGVIADILEKGMKLLGIQMPERM